MLIAVLSLSAFGALLPKSTQFFSQVAKAVTYNYYFGISGSEYVISTSSSLTPVTYESTTSATAFNYFWTYPLLSAGYNIEILAGTYTVTTSWGDGSVLTSTNGVSGTSGSPITFYFASGADLNLANSESCPVFMIYGCNYVTVVGGSFNGNGANQNSYPNGDSDTSSGNLQSAQGIVIIDCNYCLVTNAVIYNCRVFGVTINSGGGSECTSDGVTNCQIYCNYGSGSESDGWNGIQLGSTETTPIYDENDYATNNVIYGWSDVGVSMMSQNAVVTGNTIYDMWGMSTDLYNGGDAQTAIMVEGVGGSGGGNYALIAGNILSNCGTSGGSAGSGIGCASGSGTSYVLITGNTMTSCDIGGGSSDFGSLYLAESAAHCIVSFNSITSSYNGIYITSGCSNNDVYGNTYPSGVTVDYTNSGTSTTTTAPSTVAVTVTTSPAGLVGAVEANSNYGFGGSAYSESPYTFVDSVGNTVSLVANTVSGYSFTSWSDSGAQTHASAALVGTSYTTFTATYTAGGTTYSLTVTSSPTGSGYVTVNGTAESTPFTFTQGVGGTDTIAANSPANSVAGQTQYIWSSWSDSGAQTHTITVTATATITASFTEQYAVAITSSGISTDTTGTVATLQGTAKAQSALPYSVWLNSGASCTYAFTSPVSGTASEDQYVWGSTSGLSQTAQSNSGGFTVSTYGTITGTYNKQYYVSFSQSGITSNAGSNTVLTVGSTTYAYNALPTNTWITSGTTFTWASTVSGATNQRFSYSSASGITSPISTYGTSSATYNVQYEVTFTQSGISSSAGSNTVLTLGGTGYAYSYVAFK